MGTTQSYYEQLKEKAEAAALAKKAALDAAYQRMTTATFDDKGTPTYKTDASGNPMYGTLDVDYLEKKRGMGAGAESAGMMRSGQYARGLAEGQAAYRSAVIGGKEKKTSEQTAIDNELALENAKNQAMYGDNKTSSGSSRDRKSTRLNSSH